jgi:hypothetical protein
MFSIILFFRQLKLEQKTPQILSFKKVIISERHTQAGGKF